MDQRYPGDEDAGQGRPGLVAGLAGVARNMFGLLVSRIELAALELGEVRDNLARLLFIGALGIVAVLFALGCWTALIVVLAWETMGWKILLVVAIAYTLLAIGILRHARGYLAGDKLAMPATMTELRKDRDALM
ncbi:phage holin family protein [Noviherbaspirillum sp.]|uniref:phage holin family protein n=1 Tax=Noviherbaspirillum sp. TaxID=1926288 RepID=UPI002D4BA657|nr:phage holin family protein [Noviherbaspirillum sp.]HZW22805.1 phage holin family protein [Noviherbaspirillum sp.]